MPDLIPPHGGLKEPVDRSVPAAEVADFRGKAASLKRVPVSDADLSSLYRLGDGGLSPLTGPMDRAAYDRVLDGEVIIHNGKPYAFDLTFTDLLLFSQGHHPRGETREQRADVILDQLLQNP